MERQHLVLEKPEFLLKPDASKALSTELGPLYTFSNISPGSPKGESSGESLHFVIATLSMTERVKLKAARNMVYIKKERRAGSTYAPGVMPRIMQQTVH